jgi:small basic protein
MVCGTCGSTIADKAIVCYRCGAATAIPAAPQKSLPPVTRPWVIIAVMAALAAAFGYVAAAEETGTARQIGFGLVGLVTLLWAGHLAWHGRRGR